ncbi:small heat shock protein, chloroplastic-like [Andrographis paniculata]|uniref:small heat shock protein, chloroplastic-like n=1 Tax=Andrographis paniculata TaxID=175694 RepID=UPI0021E7D7A7|nr:small heat shock protein, chloroplastic-like [Andrographis paniculata]
MMTMMLCSPSPSSVAPRSSLSSQAGAAPPFALNSPPPNLRLYPRCSRSKPLTWPGTGGGGEGGGGVVKAMASENSDNLDHLQRQNNKQQQPRKRASPPPSPIGLWDRFPTARTVQQMMETMERMMEDPFAYNSGWASPSAAAEPSGGYSRGRTPWEIKEGESEYKMRFDMPGMTKEDVKVWVEEKMLVVRAEKLPKTQSGDDEEEWSAKSYGKYSCRIALPENVQFEKIKAEVKDGVLYIIIPKATSSAKVFDINVQ